ncbi:hypothetical protein OH799_05375 [Nocardia sp. NBC_00881]|uniref:hypothetical protein n=1 Tax=Nocardia sp. NBC_00881 TaxID=2975995 RepID=UPI003868BF69|nr:hypothetical protein OH799_05375 [Nocardia sp. NBC_00881]
MPNVPTIADNAELLAAGRRARSAADLESWSLRYLDQLAELESARPQPAARIAAHRRSRSRHRALGLLSVYGV